MGSIKTAEGTCQSPLHTPGWVRWEELFKTEGDIPPAGRGAYTVSQPTITDEDLSDMKDESLLDVISRKRKDSKKENK